MNHNLQPISAQWVALCSSFCKNTLLNLQNTQFLYKILERN